MSGDGSVIVGIARYGNGPEYLRAFRWTADHGMENLGTRGSYGQYNNSHATAVSVDGKTIVGRSTCPDGLQPFRWTSEVGMVGLGQPSNWRDSQATGVSGDGGVITGWGSIDNRGQSFRWTADTGFSPLDQPPDGTGAKAQAVSGDGVFIIGDYQPEQGRRRGFRWNESSGYDDLGDPPVDEGSINPMCVSADGSVIGGWYGIPDEDDPDTEWITAFLWDEEHGVRDLKDVLIDEYGLSRVVDWQLATIEGISADGQTLVGSGWHLDENGRGVVEAYRIQLPEPSCLLSCIVAGVVLFRRL